MPAVSWLRLTFALVLCTTIFPADAEEAWSLHGAIDHLISSVTSSVIFQGMTLLMQVYMSYSQVPFSVRITQAHDLTRWCADVLLDMGSKVSLANLDADTGDDGDAEPGAADHAKLECQCSQHKHTQTHVSS